MSYEDRFPFRGSWRGFEFRTDDHVMQGGRRLVSQQYPHRDDPDLEDMGAEKGKPYRINAYFIGTDYDLEVNGFLAKLNIVGPDWLVHPYLGEIWVRAWQWTRTENNRENGMCKLSIEFLPANNQPYEPSVDKVDVAITRVRETQTVIADTYELEEMSSDTFNDMIATVQGKLDILRQGIALARMPLTRANQVMTVINGIKTDVRTLLEIPQQYANAIAGFMNVLSFLDDSDEALDVDVRVRTINRITGYINNPPDAITGTPSAILFTNNTADQVMLNQQLLTGAVGLAITTYQDADTRDGVLQVIMECIDGQLNKANAQVFEALLDMRGSLIDVLLDQDLTSYRTRSIVNYMPSAVLAQQFGIDEAQLISINDATHPLFMVGDVHG